jgi:Putative phage holin Dp-1
MNTFALPGSWYDFIKKLVTLVLPATTVLLTSLGTIYGWDVAQIIQTTGAIALFLGAVVGVSNVPFQKAGGGVVGDLQVVSFADDAGGEVKTTVVSFNEDPGTLTDGQQISLRYKETPTDISEL